MHIKPYIDRLTSCEIILSTSLRAGGEASGSTFWFTAVFEKQAAEQTPEPTPMADLSGVRVLVVDDNDTNRLLVTILLKKWGCRLVEGVDEEAALDRLREASCEGDPYGVALLDLLMPGMDGFEATRAIRNLKMDIPIIAMTANAMKGDRELCLEAGMNDYLSKPVKSAELSAALERWLKEDSV